MRRQIISNVFANWLGLAAAVLAGFFLTPFILHRIGDVAFGLWVLMSTFIGYYGLLDFGLRNAIVRYVARYAATDDQENLGRVASTTLLFYSAVGLFILLLSIVLAWRLEWIFQLSPQWLSTGKALVLVTGVGTALTFPLSVFGGVLEGLQRFTWVGMVQTLATLIRSALIVVLLQAGYGVLALGVISVVVNVASSLVYAVVVFKLYPRLRLRLGYAQREMLGTLASFGVVTFWIGIAGKLRFQSDAFVIGTFVSVSAVSMFAVGSKLVIYTTDFVQAMASVFTPMFSQYDAQGDQAQLRRTLLLGNRYSALLMFPLAAVLVLLGKPVIRLWVGSQYAESYTILVILVLGLMLWFSQAASPKVLYGMSRHSTLARVLLIEGICNLGLSILLARWYGIVGVAWGTVIPMAVTCLLFLPMHVCRQTGLRLADYVRESFILPLVPTVPLVAVLWGLSHWSPPGGYVAMLLELTLGGMVYGIALLAFLYWKEGPESLAVGKWVKPGRSVRA